jgi:hypothetical protein
VHLRLNVAGRLRAHAVVLAAIALVCVQVGWTVALFAHSYFRQGYTAQVIGALALGEQADRWTGTLDGVIADSMTIDSRGQLRPVAVEGPRPPSPKGEVVGTRPPQGSPARSTRIRRGPAITAAPVPG